MSVKPMPVTLVGAGRMSQALAYLIGRGNAAASVRVWSRQAGGSLPHAVRGAEMIFCCVPSYAVREVIAGMQSAYSATALVISLAKGIEATSGKTIDELLPECLPARQPFAVIGGPMLAEDLMRDRPGVGVVGSPDRDAFKRLHELFSGTNLLLERGHDPRSVTLAGVLKNMYTLAVGITDGLEWAEPDRLTFRQRALEEMLLVGERLGIDRGTLHGPAGIADYLVTSGSPYSRNRQAGEQLGRTGQPDRAAESVASFDHFFRRVHQLNDFAIVSALAQVLQHGQSVSAVFEQFHHSVAARL